jgi:hypothetical protein
MTAHHLALYNFSMFRLPSEHPANQGFHDRNDRNFLIAEGSDGFVARSGYDDEPGPESWGEQVYPRFHVDNGDGWSPSTLSLWRDLASPMAFSYGGFHAETMRHGREWFPHQDWPPYVLWWVEAGRRPDWHEGVERLEHLHDHGPNAFAFDFKKPFDAQGRPVEIDRALVKHKMKLNADRLRDIERQAS